jgi:hypothetical protein
MSSEVAQLREQLRLEAEAAFQGLYGYAEVARHAIIQQRLQSFGETFEQLKQHLGEEEAARFMLTTLEQA